MQSSVFYLFQSHLEIIWPLKGGLRMLLLQVSFSFYAHVSFPSDQILLRGLLATMDSEQVESINDERQVSRLSFNNRLSHLQRQRTSSNSHPSAYKFVGSVLLVVFVAGICLLLISMDKRLRRLESSNLPVTGAYNGGDNGKDYGDELKKLMVGYESKINQLRREVDRLAKHSNKLSKDLTEKSFKSSLSTATGNLESINQTALLPYIESKFEDFKITINFLHAHDRESYYYQKADMMKSCLGSAFLQQNWKAKDAFLLALNNFELPHFNINVENERKANQKKDYERFSKEYDFNLPQKPFCIVVATVDNAKNFRYQYNLQSMINLNYKNFRIVIIDDGSTDNTYELILKWIEENNITHDIVVLRNEKRLTAVPNIYTAVTYHCRPDDIVVLVDGDDELLGRHAFKVFNHIYSKNDVDIVYSNHLQFYTHTRQVYRGWSQSYSDDDKRNNRYRDVIQKIAHLRTFKAKLFLNIKVEDLKDLNGEWYTSTYDEVICLPMLEMTCGRNMYIQEFFYLYNFGLGTNDLQVDQGLQKRIADEVKFKRKKYECIKQLK